MEGKCLISYIHVTVNWYFLLLCTKLRFTALSYRPCFSNSDFFSDCKTRFIQPIKLDFFFNPYCTVHSQCSQHTAALKNLSRLKVVSNVGFMVVKVLYKITIDAISAVWTCLDSKLFAWERWSGIIVLKWLVKINMLLDRTCSVWLLCIVLM